MSFDTTIKKVKDLDDVIAVVNDNSIRFVNGFNEFEETVKRSFRDAHADYELLRKDIRKLQRRSRLNWLVTAAGFVVAGYLIKKLIEKNVLDDADDVSVTDRIDGLEHRVDILENNDLK